MRSELQDQCNNVASASRSTQTRNYSLSSKCAIAAAQSFFSLSGPVLDEYDPARPNDYEDVRRAREKQRIDTEREAERQEELRAQKAVQEVDLSP